MKIRSNIDPNIWRRLKTQALMRDRSLHGLLEEIIKKWLEKAERKAA